MTTKPKPISTLLLITAISALVIGSVLLWNYSASFQGDVLGFFRIGTVLPHSPYVTPSSRVLAEGEVGYDGQLFLSIALDPSLSNPRTLDALDNPRYRYRRILFPSLGYILSLGQRPLVPYTLVLINVLCMVALVTIICRMLSSREQSAWSALFVFGIPGYWCSLLLTTSDLLAAVLLALSLEAYLNKRYGLLAITYGLAALTHETMLVVIGSLVIPLLARRNWRDATLVLSGCVPAILWNMFVLWYIPAGGSTSGIAENFAFPGAGIIVKLQTAMSGPVNAKWLFDTSAFLLLLVTLCLLLVSLLVNRRWHAVMPCVFAYAGFFFLSRMQILSYYLDFLRVYGSLVLLLVIAIPFAQWPRVTKTVLLAWCAMSIAIVTAFSMKMI